MTKSGLKKILLAVDGSDGSLDSVRYVSKMHRSQEMRVVLFNVYNKIPEAYLDLENSIPFRWKLGEIRAWQKDYENRMDNRL